jgi:hypothetical protein
MTRDSYEAKLRALLQALECQNIDALMEKEPAFLRMLGTRIALAAKLGAHLMPKDRSTATSGLPQEKP